MKKRKVLCLLDTPTCSTGFAQVSKNVLKQIHDTGLYDIDIIGINHYGDPYDLERFPYYIVPANAGGTLDFYGVTRLFNVLSGRDPAIKPPFDILFTINDMQVFEIAPSGQMGLADFIKDSQKFYKEKLPTDTWFKWIAYFPVDSRIKENWADTALKADYPVLYTDYGLDQMKYWKKDISKVTTIPHGVNTSHFFPISKKQKREFREAYFQGEVKPNDFLISVISRNQPRKDIMRSLMIYKEFKKRVPEAKLYLNMQNADSGGNVEEMALEIGIKREEYYLPDKFTADKGVNLETLNKIYNISDAVLTTTLGEGWGFCNTECMATKTTIVAPDNTSITEIFGGHENEFEDNWQNFRGIPMKCGTTKSEWFSIKDDYGRLRPITNVDDGVAKLLWVYRNPEKVNIIKENGYKWVLNLTWDKVCTKWIDIFDKAYKDVEKERKAFELKSAVAKTLSVSKEANANNLG